MISRAFVGFAANRKTKKAEKSRRILLRDDDDEKKRLGKHFTGDNPTGEKDEEEEKD